MKITREAMDRIIPAPILPLLLPSALMYLDRRQREMTARIRELRQQRITVKFPMKGNAAAAATSAQRIRDSSPQTKPWGPFVYRNHRRYSVFKIPTGGVICVGNLYGKNIDAFGIVGIFFRGLYA